MAAVWLADLASEGVVARNPYSTEVAGFLGLDLTVQKGPVGIRGSYRHFFCAPYVPDAQKDMPINIPVFTVEGQYQFGGSRKR